MSTTGKNCKSNNYAEINNMQTQVNKLQGQRRQSSYIRPVHDADIVIGQNHPQFGGHPWTLQNRGCGDRGLLINLPISFLQKSTLDFDIRGKIDYI